MVHRRAYVGAGADCVYPILLSDAHAIEIFTRAVRHPVNILALRPTTYFHGFVLWRARMGWGFCHLLYRFGVQAGRTVGLVHEEVA